VKMAADAAIRTKLMAVLFFPSIVLPSTRVFNSGSNPAFKTSHSNILCRNFLFRLMANTSVEEKPHANSLLARVTDN